jgi:hypothetical protein
MYSVGTFGQRQRLTVPAVPSPGVNSAAALSSVKL